MSIVLRAGACAALAFAASVQAGFEPIQQDRRIADSAVVYVRGIDGQFNDADFPNFANAADGDFGLFEVDDSQDFDLVSPDGTASAHAMAGASQRSLIGPTAISFEASVFANATRQPVSPPGQASASGYGASAFELDFSLASAMGVSLTLGSTLDVSDFNVFDFELSRDGQVVWTDEVVTDPLTGVADRSFTRWLVLEPGLYHLSAGLGVNASAGVAAVGEASQGSAAFTLAAVPEPQTWLLMLGGVGALAALVRRRRRAEAA
jgi:hypothetical protein